MHFQRIYVDSRDREIGGTASEFDYMLPNNIVVPEESIAVLDSVLLPVSWYVVEKLKNDRIYLWEVNRGTATYRIATVQQGYYDADSLATAAADALNEGSTLSEGYTGSSNSISGRIEIRHIPNFGDEKVHIATEEALDTLDMMTLAFYSLP